METNNKKSVWAVVINTLITLLNAILVYLQ